MTVKPQGPTSCPRIYFNLTAGRTGQGKAPHQDFIIGIPCSFFSITRRISRHQVRREPCHCIAELSSHQTSMPAAVHFCVPDVSYTEERDGGALYLPYRCYDQGNSGDH